MGAGHFDRCIQKFSNIGYLGISTLLVDIKTCNMEINECLFQCAYRGSRDINEGMLAVASVASVSPCN